MAPISIEQYVAQIFVISPIYNSSNNKHGRCYCCQKVIYPLFHYRQKIKSEEKAHLVPLNYNILGNLKTPLPPQTFPKIKCQTELF